MLPKSSYCSLAAAIMEIVHGPPLGCMNPLSPFGEAPQCVRVLRSAASDILCSVSLVENTPQQFPSYHQLSRSG